MNHKPQYVNRLPDDARPVKEFPRYFVTPDGVVYHQSRTGVVTKRRLQPMKDGHLAICISRNGKKRLRLVHHLVAFTFLPPRTNPSHEVRHLNGDPADNKVDNLKWGTHKENGEDMVRHRTCGAWTRPDSTKRGDQVFGSKINDFIAREILVVKRPGVTRARLARFYGVSVSIVKDVLAGRTWAHVCQEAHS